MSGLTDFWEQQHREQSQYWLTGTSIEELFSHYEFPVPEKKNVTEIGVGKGYATRALAKLGNVVTAVDIAANALAPLRGCTDTLLVPDLDRARPADVAICHLVFQHCEQEMVQHILASTSLAPGGVFLFQSADLVRSSPKMQELTEKGWLHWRSGGRVAALAAEAGLTVGWHGRKVYAFDGAEIEWALFRATRGT